MQVNGKSEGFEGIVHRTDGVIVLELERCLSIPTDRQAVSFFDFYKFVKTPIDRIHLLVGGARSHLPGSLANPYQLPQASVENRGNIRNLGNRFRSIV